MVVTKAKQDLKSLIPDMVLSTTYSVTILSVLQIVGYLAR